MSFTVWFVGLADSGKTTLAAALKGLLARRGVAIEFMESESIMPLYKGMLRPDDHGRALCTRSMAVIASFLNRHGTPCLITATTPLRSMRRENRTLIKNYIQVYCRCPIHILKERDTKGLYAIAEWGLLNDLPGVGGTFEEPERSDIVLDTDRKPVPLSLDILMNHLIENSWISAARKADKYFVKNKKSYRK